MILGRVKSSPYKKGGNINMDIVQENIDCSGFKLVFKDRGKEFRIDF
jgi:hypothetical protein